MNFQLNHVLRKDEPGEEGGGAAPPAAPPATPPVAPPPASPPAAPPAAPPAVEPPAEPDVKGIWPENWRETVSKDDAKVLGRLQRYASPEAALQALIAAQNRIAAGELKPALGKNATPEEVQEWRTAHGIPESPDKYDLKGIDLEGTDKTAIDAFLKAAHGANQTPEQVKATLGAWNAIKQEAMTARHEADKAAETAAQDTLRAEWGNEFRRNMNLVHGLLDGSGSQELKAKFLGGRLADGTPIGSSPDALKMLVGLALIQNPTGVVVPGGDAARDQNLREELDKLQKVPAAKKSEAQSQRQRDLIELAVKSKLMDASGNWVKG